MCPNSANNVDPDQKQSDLGRHCLPRPVWKYRIVAIWAAAWQNQQNGMCAQQRLRLAWASAQSDQSSLSAWRKLGPLATHCAQQRLWSVWADAKADLSLHWAHMPFCWFCCEVAHIARTATPIPLHYNKAPCFPKKRHHFENLPLQNLSPCWVTKMLQIAFTCELQNPVVARKRVTFTQKFATWLMKDSLFQSAHACKSIVSTFHFKSQNARVGKVAYLA